MAMLLERDAELARLLALLADARTGAGRVAFVGGEAGIGKTALVTELATTAVEVRVAWGRCDALVTPRTLGPFLDIAASLGVAAAGSRDDLLGHLLEAIVRVGPVLFVVEDAHWADDATIELIVMLGRRAVDLPLLLVVTYRDDEVTGEHPLRRAIGDLVTSSATVWLGLAGLSPEAVRTLAAAHGAPPAELHERTGGNPFYVTEVLAAPGEQVPTSVRLAVLARVARLEPEARAVLDAVAIVPGRAEGWLVEALCAPPPRAVDACVAGGVLVADAGTYTFRHELARLAVESDLSDETRRGLHRKAVTALTAREGIDPAWIAHHASGGGDDEALARSARAACLVAAARLAHRETVRHGEQALALAHLLPADEVADLKVKMVISLIGLARAGQADTMAREAVEHWRDVGDDRREAEALVLLSSAQANLGHTEASMTPIERAVEILERHPPGPELATAYLRLTSAHMLARDRDTAVIWGEKAIELTTALDNRVLLCRALIETGIADVMDGRFEGLARVRQAIEISRREGIHTVVAMGLSQIGSGCGELRRYDEAVPALVEGITITTEHQLEGGRQYMVAWLARCRFDLGQWEEAETHARDALAGPGIVVIARFVGLNTLGWLRARRGEDDAWPLLDEATEIARETRHLQRLWPNAVARAEAASLEGSLDGEVTLLEEVLELAIRCRHGLAIGELGLWLSRAGRLAAPPQGAAEPFSRWIMGDHLGAATAFRRMGCPYEAASALADTGDTASLREALATFERLGAAPMAASVGAELRARGVRAPARARTRVAAGAHPSGLTDREVEVLKLVAAGFTNPQIAASLYISRKTAEHHVSSILAKLGASTRTEAAAAAVRIGLTR